MNGRHHPYGGYDTEPRRRGGSPAAERYFDLDGGGRGRNRGRGRGRGRGGHGGHPDYDHSYDGPYNSGPNDPYFNGPTSSGYHENGPGPGGFGDDRGGYGGGFEGTQLRLQHFLIPVPPAF